MRRLARWGTLPLMAAPVGAWGLGLGDIELQSALNEPFRAEIEITATNEELESLEVSLAGQEVFDRYGLFRADFLTALDFEVTENAAGEDVLVVTSDQSITEPFVTMLLEASWARGRLLREYTALLDPPTRLPGSEGPVPVSTPETGDTGERAAGGAIEREPEPEPEPAPERSEPAAQRASEPATPAPEPQPSAAAGGGEGPGSYGPVRRGETLWAIADEFRPSGVSMNQMLVGIYRANPDAFDGNMNLLRSGTILRIPGSSELNDLSASNAAEQVAEQEQSWQGGSGEQQASAGAQPGGSDEQQARLRLVPPSEEAAAAGTSGSGEAAGGESSGEVSELRSEVDSLESELEESQRVIELRDQQLADLQSRLAELEQAVEDDASAPADAADAGAGAEADADADADAEAGAEAEVEVPLAEAGPTGDESASETPADARPADGEGDADAEESPFADEGADDAAATAAAEGDGSPGDGGAESPADGGAGTDAGGAESGAAEGETGSATASAGDEPAASPSEAPTATQPSLVGQVLGWLSQPFVWIGLGIAAVLLAGLSFVRRRRAEVDDVTGRWEALEAEVEADEAAGADAAATARLRRQTDPAAQDFVVEETEAGRQADALGALDEDAYEDSAAPREAPAAAAAAAAGAAGAETERSADDTLSSQTVMNLDQADPVAEADFHMAYGLYDQAADLMTKALEGDPGNRSYKLKLLEVYFVWGNKEAFLETARSLRGDMGEGSDADWDKVIIMGKQICPDEPMFSEAQAAAGEVDVDLEAGGSGGLDLAFGDESPPASAGDEASTAIDEIFASTDADAELSLESASERGDSDHQSWRGGSEDADMLELGATTAAGLESAFADDSGSGAAGSQQRASDERQHASGDSEAAGYESLEPTQESPTIEQPYAAEADSDDDEWSITTQESPRLESSSFDTTVGASDGYGGTGDDGSADDETSASAIFASPSFDEDTAESPTIEQPGGASDDDTAESPTVEQPDGASDTSRVQTLEQPGAGAEDSDPTGTGWETGAEPPRADDTSRVQTAEQPAASSGNGSGSGEYTAELDLDDLGLDVSDFDRLPDDLGDMPAAPDAESDTREQPTVNLDDDDDDQLLSSTGVTQVLGEDDPEYDSTNTSVLGDDDKTMMAPGPGTGGAGSDESSGQHASTSQTGDGLDFDLSAFGSDSGDDGGDTVEQPQLRSFDGASEGGDDGNDIFSADYETPVDLDVGSDSGGDNSPTDRSATPASGDAQTMTEVGTKLDLARAYVDMGDPEGARSILEEVLDEGDAGQRNEAQTLLDSLTA